MPITSSLHKIRFADCDPMGHLYNGRYLEYFMNAREDQLLDNYGLDLYAESRKTGNSWMVIQNQISYFREARLMEKVWITSRLVVMQDFKARVEMLMLDENKTQIKALLWADFIHFNVPMKQVTPLTPEQHKFYSHLLMELSGESYEERSRYLRKVDVSILDL